MDLQELRKEIDQIDEKIVALFCQRMEASAKIGAYKKEHHLPVLDQGRGEEKLNIVAAKAGPELAEATRELFQTLMQLSREHQK